jgi:hypothetical protein
METLSALQKKNGADLPSIPMAPIESLEQFTKRLNVQPDESEIQINRLANNSRYLPISFTETKLDEVFAGLWSFELKTYQVVANEIIATGVLEVFHPVAKMWLRRSGTAAVMIQQVSIKNGGSGKISNIDDKIKNTLVKDFPHLESEVLKSAAKKFGKIFGRDLNRAFEDTYSPIYTEESTGNEGLSQAIDAFSRAVTDEEFKAIWAAYPNLQSNTEFQKNYQYYLRKNSKKK